MVHPYLSGAFQWPHSGPTCAWLAYLLLMKGAIRSLCFLGAGKRLAALWPQVELEVLGGAVPALKPCVMLLPLSYAQVALCLGSSELMLVCSGVSARGFTLCHPQKQEVQGQPWLTYCFPGRPTVAFFSGNTGTKVIDELNYLWKGHDGDVMLSATQNSLKQVHML